MPFSDPPPPYNHLSLFSLTPILPCQHPKSDKPSPEGQTIKYILVLIWYGSHHKLNNKQMAEEIYKRFNEIYKSFNGSMY